jgi:hypothetical protein
MVTPHIMYLSHHALLLAIPAFLPAVIVVGVVLYVALRDRRSGSTCSGARSDTSKTETSDKKRD